MITIVLSHLVSKDSTYTLYYLIKEYKLNPLVVRFDHGFMRPNLENNIKNYHGNLVLI